ncbi:MAG: DUF402 domain-containing protein, partial [Candidatus Nezhaarchaeales archaeon]
MSVEQPSVMVRGIYTTALVKLLLDNGFRIARPSMTTANRFGLKNASKDWDARIRDHVSKRAIIIEGPRAKEVVDVLIRELPDATLKSEKLGCEVYKGVVEKVDERISYVNYGERIGLLPERLVEGQEVIVSPSRNDIGKNGYTYLTKRIRVVGRYADLIKDGWVSTPRGMPPATANELMSLGHLLKPPDWGIQWKKEAANADTSELIEEVQRLKEEAAKIMQRACEVKAPCLIYEPPTYYVVAIPYSSKKRLDELRGLVVTTMPNHHMIKSWGRRYAYAVDVIEKLMSISGPEIGNIASNVILHDVIKQGSKISIDHVKPDGTVYKLTPGVVEEFDKESMTITLRRKFKGGGVYDGLGVPKEHGDYGISIYRLGSPISKTTYYSEKGELKGIYVNISTPVEVAPRKIRYIDLEVDVVAKP